MKTFWSWLAKVLLVVAVIEAWFLYDFYHKNEQLLAENVQLETELFQAKELLLTAEEKIASLENKSLEGMLKETNKAVVSGWEKLLDAVENELNKARESIGELSQPESPSVSEPEPEKQEEPTEEIKPQEPIKGERT